MKLRSFFYLLLAGVLVLLLIGGSGFFWLTTHSPLALLQGKATTPAAAMFVPRQAPLMASLLVNPERLAAFRQLVAAPGERRRSRQEFNQLLQNLVAKKGLDYQRDIQPWIGDELTFAITTFDIDRQSENGQQPGYLLIAETQDAERSREFLDLFWQKQVAAGINLVLDQYQGVKLITAGTSLSQTQLSNTSQLDASVPGNSIATATFGDRFVLFANHPKVLRSAINNIQVPDLELIQTQAYQQAQASLEGGGVGFAFLNLPELVAHRRSSLESVVANTAQTAAPLYRSLALTLGLTRSGIVTETALIAPPGAAPEAVVPRLFNPSKALPYIPASSPLWATGINLHLFWEQLRSVLQGYDLVTNLVNQSLISWETQWGLNIPGDIFTWVEGEYALAMTPRSQGRGPGTPEWLFVAENTQAQKVQQAIAHLDDIAEQQGLGISPLTLEEQKISAWIRLVTQPASDAATQDLNGLKAQVVGAHTAVDNFKLLATSLEALGQGLKAPQNPITKTKNFQQAIAPLPQPNTGYLYLDWPASRAILQQQLPILRVVEVAAQPFLSHLRSLTLTSYSTEPDVQRQKIFIRLT